MDSIQPSSWLTMKANAALHAVAERAGQRAVQDDLVVAADRQVGVTLEFIRRLSRDELDCAAGGVAAEQRSLRAAQRLDAREVEHGKAREVDRARVAVVLVDRDRRFLLVAVVVLRNAADVEHDLRRRIGIHLEAGHRAHDVRRRRDVEVLERLVAERRHRNADVLDVLFAALGRHHDFAEGRRFARRRGSGRRFRLVRKCRRARRRTAAPHRGHSARQLEDRPIEAFA